MQDPRNPHDPHHHALPDVAATMLKRRRALLWLAGAGAGALPLLSCGGGGGDSTSASSTATTATGSTTATTATTTTTNSTAACAVTPEETEGPFPADGTNSNGSGTVDVLSLSGIVRSDIRSSIPASLGTADGVTLTVTLTLVNTGASCAALDGYAIYLWHCNRDGDYSLYSGEVIDQNYLRGVQATDAAGQVTFTTIFPACYAGRMPHIHYEVYKSLTTATSGANALKTAQIAFPTAVCDTVFASSGYSDSVENFSEISFATDNVFSDNLADGTLAIETCAISGSVAAGYAATLTVGIAV